MPIHRIDLAKGQGLKRVSHGNHARGALFANRTLSKRRQPTKVRARLSNLLKLPRRSGTFDLPLGIGWATKLPSD